MKKIKKPLRFPLLLVATAIISSPLNAAVVTLPSNTNANNFKNIFEQAVRNAGDGGTVIIPNGAYTTNKFLAIERRVVVRGQGGRFNVSIRATANMNHMVFLSRNGITLEGITFDGAKKCGNVLQNFKTSGNKFIQCRAINGKFACIGNPIGHALNAALVQGGEYDNAIFNIQLLNRVASRRVDVVNRTIIENARIRNFGNTGVQLDNANDGLNYVTDMKSHTVRGCTITGPGQFAVGCTLARNIDYNKNTLTCKDDPIHVEFKSSNVNSYRNRLTTTARNGQGQPVFSCITIITGDKILGLNQQNPTPVDHANRVTNSRHVENILLGRSFFGAWATEATDIKFLRNNHTGNNPRFEKIFLSTGDKNRQSFGGSSRSQGTKRFLVSGNIGVRKRDMFFATNVGHTIQQAN